MILTNLGKIVFSACLAVVATAFVSPGGDEIRWNKLSHDFGDLKSGDKVETNFVCYNGDDTLVLENVQPSCGCVVPGWTRRPIMPHDSTIIHVVFDTNGKSGRHEKVIAVYSNQGLFELVVKANILRK